jgi:hypothetical protein
MLVVSLTVLQSPSAAWMSLSETVEHALMITLIGST